MNDRLTVEIAKRILQHVGVSDNGFSNLGILCNELKSESYLNVEYDDGEVKHSIYSGQVKFDSCCVRGIVIDLDDLNYCFVWRTDDGPIYAIDLPYSGPEYDETKFLVHNGESWIVPPMIIKAYLLAAFERLTSLGILWGRVESFDDLLKAAKEFLG